MHLESCDKTQMAAHTVRRSAEASTRDARARRTRHVDMVARADRDYTCTRHSPLVRHAQGAAPTHPSAHCTQEPPPQPGYSSKTAAPHSHFTCARACLSALRAQVQGHRTDTHSGTPGQCRCLSRHHASWSTAARAPPQQAAPQRATARLVTIRPRTHPRPRSASRRSCTRAPTDDRRAASRRTDRVRSTDAAKQPPAVGWRDHFPPGLPHRRLERRDVVPLQVLRSP